MQLESQYFCVVQRDLVDTCGVNVRAQYILNSINCRTVLYPKDIFIQLIVKAIYTVSYLTESHPRPHRMTWKLITMREKHLDCKEQRSLTFAFDSCLVAKPNIRTPSVDCTGMRSRVGYRYINTAMFELNLVNQLSKYVFRSDTTEARLSAIFCLPQFVSSLHSRCNLSNPKLVASKLRQKFKVIREMNCREQGRVWYHEFSTRGLQKSNAI